MVPRFLRLRLEAALRQSLYDGEGGPAVDFTTPASEAALTSSNSVSWRVFDNPVSLFIGGITAVLLELAEPSVRSGVWDHTTFRTDPMKRMKRTGLAAMVTVYGARSVAEKMIAGVRKMHERVEGVTPAGVPYRANDPQLLQWVHATAAFGFLEAYDRYVKPVAATERDLYYAEGAPVSRLYGAENAPVSEKELLGLFDVMLPKLERSEIVFEFLGIMRNLPLLPRPLRFLNGLFIRAAVDILPAPVRETLGLDQGYLLPPGVKTFISVLGSTAGNLQLESTPAAQARLRVAG